MSQPVGIEPADAFEIAEALQWLRDWFASDPDLARSLRQFSLGLVTLTEISSDLDRFASTLGWRP
jgi:thymidine phosphorylase